MSYSEYILNRDLFVKQGSNSIPERLKIWYGSGLDIPSKLVSNNWSVISGEEKIKSSLYVILTTPIGVRYRRPDFGSMLPYLVFSKINSLLESELINYTKEAIEQWESRVVVTNVKVDIENPIEDQVNLTIFYKLKGTQQEESLDILFAKDSQVPFKQPKSFTVGGYYVFN